MELFARESISPTPLIKRAPEETISLLRARCTFLLRSVSMTLHFLTSFALEVEEIKPDRFKDNLQRLDKHLHDTENPRKCELYLEREKEHIASFIQHQHNYIRDREKELRDIIDLLTRAMANLNVENREFYQRINQQGQKIIQISGLDDIKKIKTALQAEVSRMWEIVHLKQDQEQHQIKLLSGQVHHLKNELEKAKNKALTDAMTGVYNRQALDEYLAERINRILDDPRDFCVLMIDIDDFKLINDKFGHLIGDRALAALAQKFRSSIRSEDFLARYGGEEFMVIMEGAGFRNALKNARRICNMIATVRYATSDSQTSDHLSMTISIGVTHYKKGDTVSTIIARADKALYDAKRKGKNCVVGRKT